MARTNGEHMGGPRAMKALLRKVKCQTRTVTSPVLGRVFFFACVHNVGLAYISSDLRTCTQRMFARNISALPSISLLLHSVFLCPPPPPPILFLSLSLSLSLCLSLSLSLSLSLCLSLSLSLSLPLSLPPSLFVALFS